MLMRTTVLTLLLTSTISCQSLSSEELLFYKSDISEKGYSLSYKTKQFERKEDGVVTSINGEDVVVVQGFYTFVDLAGGSNSVEFVADENGYRPKVKTVAASSGLERNQDAVVPYVGSNVLKTLIGGGMGKR